MAKTGNKPGFHPLTSRVARARAALQEKAEKWVKDFDRAIEVAIEDGKVEVATKAIQWAFEHLEDEDGVRVVESSVDKPKETGAPSGPQIKIGFSLGGIPQTKQLQPAQQVQVIEVKPEPEKEPESI